MVSQQQRTGERRIGLRPQDHALERLHPNASKLAQEKPQHEEPPVATPREPTPDDTICRPPDTPSDEAFHSQDEQIFPDGSPPPTASTSMRSPEHGENGMSALPYQSSLLSAELPTTASNIRATAFTTSGKTASSSSPYRRNSTKRKSTMDDGDTSDDVLWGIGPPKKIRTIYNKGNLKGYGASSGIDSRRDRNKAVGSSPTGKRGRPMFKKGIAETVLAQVDKQEAKRTVAFKVPEPYSITSRETRALERSKSSHENQPSNGRKGFKRPDQVPSAIGTSMPEEAPQVFIVPPVLPDTSPKPRATRSKKFKVPGTILTRNVLHTTDLEPLLNSAPPKFNLQDIQPPLPNSSITASSLPSNDAASFSSSFSSAPDSPEINASIQDINFDIQPVPFVRELHTTTKCPVCKERVERNFLEEFCSGEALNMREQTRFCKAHRIRSAETEWEENGYPTIDWLQFDGRIARFHADLDNILRGRRSSFYRNKFEESLKSNKNRTVQKRFMDSGLEAPELGYYGSRGAKLMSDNIMTHFTPRIRALAASNKLLRADGVSGYVQAVLVPELAVLLIMEDMRTDEEGARQVLEQSTEVGRLLCEEEDELIIEAGDGGERADGG